MTVNPPEFRLARTGHRLTVTLERAAARNALTTPLLEAVVDAIATAIAEDEVRVLVLRGDGPAFSAGADLHEYLATARLPAAEQRDAYARMARALDAFERLPVVKVARLHGAVVGAGLVLATLCELRVADTSARFSVPEVALGIPFSMAGYPRLVRLIGTTRASALMLTGMVMGAREAEAAGLLTRVAEPGDLDRVVEETVAPVAGLPRFLIADAVDRMRDAAERLLPTPGTDVTGLVLASLDPDCRDLAAAYTARAVGARGGSAAAR